MLTKVKEAVRFLRTNKVCSERRRTGHCPHEGCQFAVESAAAIESLIAENESLRADIDVLTAPPVRVAA